MKHVLAATALSALAALPAWAQQVQPYPTQYPPAGQATQPGDVVAPGLVGEIQQQLQLEGFYRGPIDGIFGPETQQSLAQWQASRGVAATGRLDSASLAALGLTGDPQQAVLPEETGEYGEIESFRRDNMSAPNVVGERIQERQTGVPAPAEQVQPFD